MHLHVTSEDVSKAYTTQNYDALSGRNVGANPARISGSREVSPGSSIGRLYNDIGKPRWQVNLPRDNPEMQEVYEKYLFPLLEYHADTVLENGEWEKRDLAGRESMLRGIMTEARANLKESFAAVPAGPRAEANLIININRLRNSGSVPFRDMMDVFETREEDLADLSIAQLQLLYDSIKNAQDVYGGREDTALER